MQDFLFRLADVDLLFTRKKKLDESFNINEEENEEKIDDDLYEMYKSFLEKMDNVGPQLFDDYDFIAKLLSGLKIQQELLIRQNQILNHVFS